MATSGLHIRRVHGPRVTLKRSDTESFDDMDIENVEDEESSTAFMPTENNNKTFRDNPGKRARQSTGFLDPSTLVVDSTTDEKSDEEVGPTVKKLKQEPSPHLEDDDMNDTDSNGRLIRSVSLPPPPIIPDISPIVSREGTPESQVGVSDVASAVATASIGGNVSANSLQLSVKLPEGHQGSFQINIDFSSMVGHNNAVFVLPPMAIMAGPVPSAAPAIEASSTSLKNPIKLYTVPYIGKQKLNKRGFADLAGEIRNRIYHLVFAGRRFRFGSHHEDLSRSSQLLRTSRQIYKEARSYLYGENYFIFERDSSTRGNFWQPSWKEIGYTDVQRFLEMIGPHSISLLRDVGIEFEDASQASTPRYTQDERRYVTDKHLLYILELLGKHGQLRRMVVGFYGRREAKPSRDAKFFDTLKKVRTEELICAHPTNPEHFMTEFSVQSSGFPHYHHGPMKMPGRMLRELMDTMVVKKKEG